MVKLTVDKKEGYREKKHNPFDLSMDGKVDIWDHILYDIFYGDDDDRFTLNPTTDLRTRALA